jgi:hypothetical protein
MKTDCLTSGDGELMIMAAHRGAMHQAPEDAEAFTDWYIDYVSPVATKKDMLLLTRDTLTDGFSPLWGDTALWVPFFLFMWESLNEEERGMVDRMVAYTGRLGSDAYNKYGPDTAHGDDDEGCPGRMPSDHPLEGAVGQRMLVNMHRYCLGRMTYMPEVCRSWLRAWWHYVNIETRYKMLVTTGLALLNGGCGMDCDAGAWMAFFRNGFTELAEKDQAALKQDIIKGGATPADVEKLMQGDWAKGVFKWTRPS